jgi:hypothetical protein
MWRRSCVAVTLVAVLLLFGSLTALAAGPPGGAVTQIGTSGRWISRSSYGSGDWARPDDLYYYTDSVGNLAIVEHASSDALTIDTFNPSTLQPVGQTRSISLAGWPDWGRFYAAPDGDFYVLVGRKNLTDDDKRDVVAVRRYDSEWKLLGTAYVKGDATQGGVKGIYSAFDNSAPHMVLVGNRLVVHMARLIYPIDGIRHQVNLTFEVNVDSMTATSFDKLGGVAYSSHSFQQLVAMNGSYLVMVDHGDAYPRAIQMGVMAGYPDQRQVSTYDLFNFNGSIGNNFTGATVTALVSGPSGIVVLGNSIPQPDAPNGPLGSRDEQRNVYATSADPGTGAHTVQWLTHFASNGAAGALEPRVVQVGPDRYAVLFSVRDGTSDRLEYRLIDSNGTVLASASFPSVLFYASSDPILIGSRVYWVGTDTSSQSKPVYLFGINVADPAAPSLLPWQGGSETPPNTKITKAKINQKKRMATFTFKAIGTATGFQCELRRKHGHRHSTFNRCSSPKTYQRLTPGSYAFEARALSSTGKDASPAKKRFKMRKAGRG